VFDPESTHEFGGWVSLAARVQGGRGCRAPRLPHGGAKWAGLLYAESSIT